MRLKTITVYVEYRMNAGDDYPKWKALRARVRCGTQFGTDLVRPTLQDPDQLKIEVINRLVGDGISCDELVFEFAPLLQRKGCQSCVYQMNDGKVTFTRSA